MQLIRVLPDGRLERPPPSVSEFVAEIGAGYADLYRAVGHHPPWVGYVAMEEEVCVGTCGFKSPPVDGRVELAYFTFPPYEGRGLATRMARALITIAQVADPSLCVVAQTRPHESASTSILRKLGFTCARTVQHPDDGEVWEWELPPSE